MFGYFAWNSGICSAYNVGSCDGIVPPRWWKRIVAGGSVCVPPAPLLPAGAPHAASATLPAVVAATAPPTRMSPLRVTIVFCSLPPYRSPVAPAARWQHHTAAQYMEHPLEPPPEPQPQPAPTGGFLPWTSLPDQA